VFTQDAGRFWSDPFLDLCCGRRGEAAG